MGLKCRSRCFPSPCPSSVLSTEYAIHLLDSCSSAGSTPRLCIAVEMVSPATYVQEVQAKSVDILSVEQRKSSESQMETRLSWNSINSQGGKTSETLSGPPQLQEQSSSAEIASEKGMGTVADCIVFVFISIFHRFVKRIRGCFTTVKTKTNILSSFKKASSLGSKMLPTSSPSTICSFWISCIDNFQW